MQISKSAEIASSESSQDSGHQMVNQLHHVKFSETLFDIDQAIRSKSALQNSL